jgi:hypothetical protein
MSGTAGLGGAQSPDDTVKLFGDYDAHRPDSRVKKVAMPCRYRQSGQSVNRWLTTIARAKMPL